MNCPLNNEAMKMPSTRYTKGLPNVKFGPCETKISKPHISENSGIYNFHRNHWSKGSLMKVSSPSIPPTLFNFYCSIMEILGHLCHWASGIILWRGGNEGSSLWIPLICMEHKYSLFDSKTMYIYLNWDQVGMRDTDGFPSLWSKAMGSLLTDKYKRLFGGQIFLHHPQTLEHQ